MKAKILSGLIISTVFATSCISEFDAKLPSNDEQILLVEGNIMENTDLVFHLSKSFPLNTSFDPTVSLNVEAKLTLIGSDGYQSPPAISMGNGAYQLSTGELNDDVAYGIQIEYDGDTYQSALSKPLHTPEIDSVSWIQPEYGGTIYFHVSTHDDPEGAKFFSWDYEEIWEFVANYSTTIFMDPRTGTFYTDESAPYYYCWGRAKSKDFLIGSTESLAENRIINKQLYEGHPEDKRFSMLYCVTLNQKAISKSAFEYYQNKITLNGEMGGIFTPQPSEIMGNISCITNPSKKVMGYIEVTKNITQKRIFVDPYHLTYPVRYDYCTTITHDSLLTIMEEIGGSSLTDMYSMGYRPVFQDLSFLPQIFPGAWSRGISCTDCRYGGGSKNKPDFWPSNHE